MSAIRVVLADDSVVVRRIMADVFARAEGFELVANVANGREAVEIVDELDPDVVVLDIEMPEMDGIEALQAIRQRRPRLPVVMFSTVARRGAAATMEALALGASDYVTKPGTLSGVREAIESMEQELLPRLKALGRRPRALGSAPPAVRPSGPGGAKRCIAGGAEVVVVGASTGGPVAVSKLIGQLPSDFDVPVVVVQHMPPLFTKHFAEQLAQRVRLPVAEVEDGQPVQGGEIWIGRGGHHVELTRGANGELLLKLTDDEPVHFCRPAVDVLFKSTARVCGRRSLAVVMTGMGQDGLEGARSIVDAGGVVVAQDEASSVVWGMPGSVARAGLATYLGDPEVLAQHVALVAGSPPVRQSG
ncbi:MAG: chemotaxis-specific protein-glutamate methyltransferase CheB [Myxococcales bacterium]|nr:chemotaxis-specific protein-glutamate methyltransferase CheB [Myxococcales bacterium]